MDFPRYVFTSEGEEKCSLGTYGVAMVEDKEEFDAAIEAGYKEAVSDLFEKSEIKSFKKAPPKKFKEVKKEDPDDF